MGKARRVLDSRIGNRGVVRLTTGETVTGRLLALDKKDGTVALGDAERERAARGSGRVIRAALGFAIVRGFCIVSINVHDAASPIGWAGHADTLARSQTAAFDYATVMRESGALQRGAAAPAAPSAASTALRR